MALDADKMTAAGYYHHPDGNGVDWQRDLDMSGSVEDTLGVEGYVSGDFSRKLNAMNGGLGMSLVFRPGSVSQTVDALAMARSVAQIHQQELSIAVDDAHKKQVALDEQLTHAQNQRLNAEISLRGKNNAPAGERAQATLDLQQALARELQARMAAEENAVLYIEADIMLNNGRVWWPRSAADVNQARQYIAKRQGDKAATEQLIAGDKKDLAALLAAAERTKQDIDRIRSGLVPEKYRPDSEKAAARQQQLTGAAARRQLEQQQEAAVQRQIDEFQYQINIAVQQKASADGRASAHDGAANNLQNEQNVLRQRQQQLFDGYQRFVNQGVMNDGFHPLFRVGSTMLQQSNAVKAQADAKQNDINRERNAAAQARHEAAQLQQRAQQYQRDKAGAENRLNALRQEHQARAQADAAAASQASAEAAARQAADAKAKAEADARARVSAQLRKATAELMARAGVHPAPVYTAQMVSAADAALRAPGAMVLGGHPGTAQFAAAGGGAMELADDILYVLSKGWAELKRAATVNALGPRLGVVVAGFWPMEAGKGSDKVPGRDVPALFSYPLSAVQGSGVSLTPGASTANLPVRGALVLENDRLTLRLIKTGEGSLPWTVPVLKAVRDEATGLDRITVPAVGGLPPRTVLINPVPVPVAPADTGNRSPVPVTPWHTGTAAKPVETLVTTVTPEADVNGLQDFIYWRPDAVGTGVEPVYVMFSNPYGETNAKGKYSGRDYNTDKAGGPIQNLDWRSASIDRAGIDKVKLHAGRFGEFPENKVMIDRLEKILNGEMETTDTDKRFYTHEIRELERYRALNVPDGLSPEDNGATWNNAHTATLEDYQLSSDRSLLYTPEAIKAGGE